MFTAKVFKSGNSQAIRIPKQLSTDREEFTINKIGEVYILTPSDDPWYLLRESLGSFSGDLCKNVSSLHGQSSLKERICKCTCLTPTPASML